MRPLADRAAQAGLVPVGRDDALIHYSFGHAAGLAFANRHLSGQIGDSQTLQSHRDDNGHEHQRRQHFRQRETGLLPPRDGERLSARRAGLRSLRFHSSAGCGFA